MIQKFAVVDIETTGGSAVQERITEIGIVLHDGQQVLGSYDTLINPGRQIPPFITRLTGITNEMVADAPYFYEVAKDIVEWTEGAVFVAHNVRFDYGFIREEFKRLGYSYTRKRMCTVRMGRKFLPGLPSYKLGNLIKHFDIPVDARHRALADAKATARLLEIILAQTNDAEPISEIVAFGIEQTHLPKGITMEQLQQLPDECGVYYFHNEEGEVVYVGKSLNIRKRVLSHFANTNRKGNRIHDHVRSISYEVTGSELIALLYESHEIKRLRPFINRAQRHRHFPYVVYTYKNDSGYRCFDIAKATVKERANLEVVCDYPLKGNAHAHLSKMIEQHVLCKRLCGIEKPQSNCLYHQIKLCNGACIGQEEVEVYNQRAEQAIMQMGLTIEKDLLLIDQGRSIDERAVVLIQDGIYKGFGYVQVEELNDLSTAMEAIKPYHNNAEVLRIIRQQISKNRNLLIRELSATTL